jgi:hypothetical protein
MIATPTASSEPTIASSAADVLSVTDGAISATDAGANSLVYFNNATKRLVPITLGAGVSVSGNAIYAAPIATGAWTTGWIPASLWIPCTTNGCGVDSRELSTNRTNWDELAFDPGVNEFAQAFIMLPSNYNNGTITARFYWTSSTGTGNVIFAIQGRAFADDDSLDTAFGTAQSVTDTLLAVNDMHITSATSAVTISGTPAASRPILFQIYRDATAAGDTLSSDARFLGLEISYTAV